MKFVISNVKLCILLIITKFEALKPVLVARLQWKRAPGVLSTSFATSTVVCVDQNLENEI